MYYSTCCMLSNQLEQQLEQQLELIKRQIDQQQDLQIENGKSKFQAIAQFALR